MKIGPTFAAALLAGGCNNGVAWDAASGDVQVNGVSLSENPQDPESLQVAAVLAAHDPNKAPPPAPPTQAEVNAQVMIAKGLAVAADFTAAQQSLASSSAQAAIAAALHGLGVQ